MTKIFYILVFGLAILGCDKKGSLDGVKDRAQAENESGRDVDNRNLAEKAARMESELTLRHSYFAALEGNFEGTVRVGNKDYGMRATMVKTLPLYSGGRTRQLSEIEADLNNLFLKVQVLQWNPKDTATAVGCRFSEIKPDLGRGVLILASSDCPNVYEIYLSQADKHPFDEKEIKAAHLSERVQNQGLKVISNLIGSIRPSLNANSYQFQLQRK